MKQYTLVTGSKKKLKEFRNIIGKELEHIELDLPEIQSVKVKEVVRAKLMEAYKQEAIPVMVEDTGLYLEAWNQFPGALIKWMIDTTGLRGICRMLDGFASRKAVAKTIIGIYDGASEPQFFEGIVAGEIADHPRPEPSEDDFGWDLIFIPEGSSNREKRTFGEMTLEEKNEYSMRNKAIQALLAYLKK